MRVAVLSDIHGNLKAFEEVLADMETLHIDEILCLGDNIGYGPEPEGVMELLHRVNVPSILGNHEMGILDERSLGWFNPTARSTLLRTQALLSPRSLAAISELPTHVKRPGCLGVHGCPPADVFTYLFELSLPVLRETIGNMDEAICFVGHTHWLQIVSWEDETVTQRRLPVGRISLPERSRHIINVGSVGQPRDGNPHAKYVIWDDHCRSLEVRSVPYDIQATAQKILALGFPRIYADRLWQAI
jgi:diadenosine tetraphosphatase ApaH/serine/threonine PP2A family protein phosphatase